MKRYNRREFSKFAALTGAGTFGLPLFAGMDMTSSKNKIKGRNANLKISLNAFSFDKPLRAGTMSLDDLLDFCARNRFRRC